MSLAALVFSMVSMFDRLRLQRKRGGVLLSTRCNRFYFIAFSRDKTNERSVRQITDARQTEDSSSICNLQIEADLAATGSPPPNLKIAIDRTLPDRCLCQQNRPLALSVLQLSRCRGIRKYIRNAPASPGPSYLVERPCNTVHSHNTKCTKNHDDPHRGLNRRSYHNNCRDIAPPPSPPSS